MKSLLYHLIRLLNRRYVLSNENVKEITSSTLKKDTKYIEAVIASAESIEGVHDNFKLKVKLQGSNQEQTFFLKSIGDGRFLRFWFPWTVTTEYRHLHDTVFQGLQTKYLKKPSEVFVSYASDHKSAFSISRDIVEGAVTESSNSTYEFKDKSRLAFKLLCNVKTLTREEKEDFNQLELKSLAEFLIHMYLLNLEDLKADNISLINVHNQNGDKNYISLIDTCYRKNDRIFKFLNHFRSKPWYIHYNISFDSFIKQFKTLQKLMKNHHPHNQDILDSIIEIAPEILRDFIKKWDDSLAKTVQALHAEDTGLPKTKCDYLLLEALFPRALMIEKCDHLIKFLKKEALTRGKSEIVSQIDTIQQESKEYLEASTENPGLFDIRNFAQKHKVGDLKNSRYYKHAALWFTSACFMIISSALIAFLGTFYALNIVIIAFGAVIATFIGIGFILKGLCEIDPGLNLGSTAKRDMAPGKATSDSRSEPTHVELNLSEAQEGIMLGVGYNAGLSLNQIQSANPQLERSASMPNRLNSNPSSTLNRCKSDSELATSDDKLHI